MIHSNHKKEVIVYRWNTDKSPEMFTECYCGAIYPINCYMLKPDMMCSILLHRKNSNNKR